MINQSIHQSSLGRSSVISFIFHFSIQAGLILQSNKKKTGEAKAVGLAHTPLHERWK
jgi:hypothetical protein